jgi:predicted ABC-type ATPase
VSLSFSGPTLHLLAGINGAGKTTFYQKVLQEMTPGAEFVNADELARERWPDEIDARSAEAARLADQRRRALLEERRTFVAETVFSHPSKLELVREARVRGFRVVLYHVHVSTPDLARERVATRVSRGGHDVPDEKIDARFPRTLELIRQAATFADLTYVFDNSGLGRTHTHVMTLEHGTVVRLAARIPSWARQVYVAEIARFHSGAGG